MAYEMGKTTHVTERIIVYRDESRRWRWRYHGNGISLDSHQSYEALADARESAEVAYPATEIVVGTSEEPHERRRPLRGASAAAKLLMTLVVWRSRGR